MFNKMKMVQIISLLVASMFSLSAFAELGDFSVMANISSSHSKNFYLDSNNNPRNYNRQNYGITGILEISPFSELNFGFFENSFDETSLYAAINIRKTYHISTLEIAPGIMIGGATGYLDSPMRTFIGGIAPIVLANVSVTTRDRFRIIVGFAPAINNQTSNVVTLQLGWKF